MQTAKSKCPFTAAIAVILAPLTMLSEIYYASPGGTGTGTESSPFSLSSGIDKVKTTSDTLILKSGRYALAGAIAFNGTDNGNEPTRVLGETGNPADVVIDAQGKGEAFRINKNVLVAGITIMNGSNAGFPTSSCRNRAAGIRIGWTGAEDTLSIVSNCVVTCCTNAFTSATRYDSKVVYGGAVCVFDNGLLVDSHVTNNAAVYRCAGVVLNGGRLIGGSISHNAAADSAGGLIVERGIDAFVADAEISGNSAAVDGCGGGALCALDGSTLVLTNCTFSGNSAGYGGGVDAWSGTALSCIDCRLVDNVAGHVGGGACVRGTSQADVRGCVFDGNAVTGTNNDTDFGGGLGAYEQMDGASLTVYCTMFRNNHSASRGGGFSGPWGVSSATAKLATYANLVNCVFTNNTSSGRGAGVCLRDNEQSDLGNRFLMRNCLVAMNRTTSTTSSEGAGVYFVAYANPILDSCTIVSNRTESSVSGAGLYHRWGGTVTNCVIAFNVKGGSLESGTTWCLDGNTSTPKSSVYRNCCVWPEASNVFLTANGCVNANPRFADPLHGDFTLAARSPCRDSGILEGWMSNAYDLGGNMRALGSAPDIGCYEKRPRGFSIRFR